MNTLIWLQLSFDPFPFFQQYILAYCKHYILIENDDLGDWSPKKDCCWRLYIALAICSEAFFRVKWLRRWLPHRLLKCQSPTTVLLGTPINQMIILNQGMLLLGSNRFFFIYIEYCISSKNQTGIQVYPIFLKLKAEILLTHKWVHIPHHFVVHRVPCRRFCMDWVTQLSHNYVKNL